MILSDLILAATTTSCEKKRVKLLKSLPAATTTEATETATKSMMAKKDDLKVKSEEHEQLKGKIKEEVEHENEMHGKHYNE